MYNNIIFLNFPKATTWFLFRVLYYFYALTNVSFYDLKLFMEWIEKFHNITKKFAYYSFSFKLKYFFLQLENIREGRFTYYITFSQEPLTFISGIFHKENIFTFKLLKKSIFSYYLYFQL